MTSELPVAPPSGEPSVSSASRPRIPKKVAVRLAVVGAAVVVGVGLLVAQTSKSSHASLAKWVVVPRTAPRGPGGSDGTVPSAPSDAPVTLGDNIATIPVPQGWKATVGDDKTSVDFDGGDLTAYIYVVSGNTESASALVSELPGDLLNSDADLSNLHLDPSETLTVSGLVTGAARLAYTADEKSDAATLHDLGNLFAYTRNDGWVMNIQVLAQGSDTADAGKKLTTSTAVATLLTGAYNSFAHL